MKEPLLEYDCDIHGVVKAKVVKIFHDKEKGLLTLTISCKICEAIKNAIKEIEAKSSP